MKEKNEVEKAREVIEAEKKKKSEVCLKEIVEVLKKHNCGLSVVPLITIGGRHPEIAVNVNEPEKPKVSQ